MEQKITRLFMVALLSCVTAISICQNQPIIPCDKLPQAPNPPTAVNDFANIIDNDAQQKMEGDIRSYWDSTSIALAVVSVQNMNGNEVGDYALSLFRCWGIGGSGSNRGILFLISMDERKIWIATGYGIESFLPDVTCHKITEEHVKPLCKEGRYTDAVVAGVQQIFQTLGTMSWEQRMEGIVAEKAASDKKRARVKNTVIDILLVLGMLTLLIIIVRLILKRAARNKLRKQIAGLITKTTQEISLAHGRVSTALDWYKVQAKWAKEEAEGHEVQATSTLNQARKALRKANRGYKENPEEAQGLIIKAQELVEKSFTNFLKIDQGLKAKIIKFSAEAPVRLDVARQQVKKSLETIAALSAKGYRFNHATSEQVDFNNILEKYGSGIGDGDAQHVIYTQAEIILKQSSESLDSLLTMVQKQEVVSEHVASLIIAGKKQYENARQHLGLFESYKCLYPETVWREDEVLLRKLAAKLEPQQLDNLHTEILELNGMQQQEFSTAAIKYDALKSTIDQVEALCSKVADIAVEQDRNKSLYANASSSASQLVQKAMQKVKNSDVKAETRKLAKAAQQKLEEAKIQSSKTILDWLLLMLLVNAAVDLANKAIRGAESDVKDAQDKRDEKERRRSKITSDSYAAASAYSSSYSSYSSSSDDSSASFGGFDGGDSGGGGGGSTW